MKNNLTIELQGTYPVLPTPFTNSGEIDLQSFECVIDYVVNSGVDGVVFPGLASEYEQLSKEERLTLTAIVGKKLNGRTPFIIGASASSPELAIEYALAGSNAGACCAMVMAPFKFADNPQEMINFFKVLANSSGITIMLQNAPKPIGAGLAIEVIEKILQEVPQVNYVKEETMPCGQKMTEILSVPSENLKGVFGGAGGRYIIDELERGSLGTLPACELTEYHVALVNAYRKNDKNLAREIFIKILPILNMQAVYRCSLTKEILLKRGIIKSNFVRVPGPKIDEIDRKELFKFYSLINNDFQ